MNASMKPYYLTNGLHLLLTKLNDLGRSQVAYVIEGYQYHIKKIQPGAARAREVNVVLDKLIDQDKEQRRKLYKNVSCKSGCSACCHLKIEITHDEADLLAERVRGGVTIDMDRLKKQAVEMTDGQFFGKLNWNDNACVFLSKGGTCRIYEDRPMACRKYHVTSGAPSCELTPTGQSQAVAMLVAPNAEALVSAALDLDKDRGVLSRLLLEKLTSGDQ